MSKSPNDVRPRAGLFAALARQLQSRVAPFVAPHMPERYYEIYRATLSRETRQLESVEGLPMASIDDGHFTPLIRTPDGLAVTPRILDILSQAPRLLIVGSVGSGKSTFLRSIAWRFAGQIDESDVRWLTYKLFGQSVQELLPVLVDLRDFGGHQSLLDLMLSELATHGFPGARDFLRERLESGQCILLLDGLDALGDDGRRAQIQEMASSYPRNVWVVSTRPLADQPTLHEFVPLMVEGLGDTDVEALANHCLGERSVSALGFLAARARSESLLQVARQPLMTAAMCAQLKRSAVRRVHLDTLYDACLEMLLGEWSRQAGHPQRYQLVDQLRILQTIAYEMQREKCWTSRIDALLSLVRARLSEANQAHAEDILDTLTRRQGVLRPDVPGGQDYRFLAPAFQSYLAAHWLVSTDQTRLLLPHVDDPWWQDTVALTAGLLPDPMPFLRDVEEKSRREPHKWLLLAQCVAEVEGSEPTLYERVEDNLCALMLVEDGVYWRPAAIAIAGMNHQDPKDFFTSLLRNGSDGERRRRAALVLGRLAEPWAIPSLGAAISDSDPNVRQQAAWALGFIPSEQAVRVLPRAMGSPFPGVRQAAAEALVKQGKQPELAGNVVSQLITALDAPEADLASLAENALLQIGSVATPQLLTALNNRRISSAQRSRVARVLGHLGDERALSDLIDAVLQGESDQVEGYTEAVARIGAPAVQPLIHALEGRDITTSSGLVSSLSKIGAPAVGPLIEAIAGNAPEVRNAAVKALEGVGTPAIEPLTHALLFDNRLEVRRRALEVLGHVGEGHVVAALIGALDDSDLGVRINAIRHLGSLGIVEAVPQLADILQHGDDESLLRAAITSLGEIGDPRTVEPLLKTLVNADLLSVTSNALLQFGEQAVEPIIKVLHIPETSAEIREASWDILETIGTRGRPEDQSLLGLASTYAQLHQQSPESAEIVALTENLSWWFHGHELHQSLATGLALASAEDLESISNSTASFEWLAQLETWFRPHVKDILWGFRDVIENINVFHSLTRRDSQRNILISALDRLEEVGQTIESRTLPFEQTVFLQVVSRWHDMIFASIKELRGRASLLINLLTPVLPLRGAQLVTTAVFELFNEGDSAARNVSVSLRSVDIHGAGVEIVNGERVGLSPLGIGEERQVEIGIAPRRARTAELTFEVHYDDDERQGVVHRHGFQIRFVEAPSRYTPIDRSPYIVGMPVKTSEMFFGRQDIFRWVRENVSGKHQEQPLLLYGERRMGKTSVLYQLLQQPPTADHLCLLFDLQLYGYIDTASELLFELASAISMRLQEAGMAAQDPDWTEYNEHPYRAFLAFCDSLDRMLENRRLLIMLDEFGVLIGKVRDRILDAAIFDYLRGVTQRSSKFTFLFTGAYEVRRMQQDFKSILFNMPKVRKISYLTEGEVSDLILRPVEGILTYHPLIIPRIRRVTAGHPYFTQYICDELVKLARQQQTNYVELTGLDFVIRGVLQDAAGNIENSIFNFLERSEKLVLATLAHVTDDVRVFVPMGDIVSLLGRRHLTMAREEIIQALQALKERDLVNEMRIGQQLRYSFKMGLTRTWLRQNEILLRMGQETEE